MLEIVFKIYSCLLRGFCIPKEFFAAFISIFIEHIIVETLFFNVRKLKISFFSKSKNNEIKILKTKHQAKKKNPNCYENIYITNLVISHKTKIPVIVHKVHI